MQGGDIRNMVVVVACENGSVLIEERLRLQFELGRFSKGGFVHEQMHK
eukprot:CAMPEP_0181220466 /NCGR_PEP_ID=MMETSP1096-20121128/28854_1 /TAXON_ID=156174 ORGANISM="Chrysochromulina ericina, Strain CCMP281" /NCGR_SAMPLE_ID=MMETSP1096 /ASSEMBLY_ACC=CAM_ASM_000453 /LENGTH=47 /DNA_ID= /DNA_START= /DNA_END= /DNA_ORIENTATION=